MEAWGGGNLRTIMINDVNDVNMDLTSYFANLYSMVMADNDKSDEEMILLYRIGKEQFKLTEEEMDRMIITDETLYYIPTSEKDKLLYLYDMARIAWADGKVVPTERDLLKRTMERFGVSQDNIDDLTDFLLEKGQENLSHEEFLKYVS